jgi:hypothetical protein
MGTITRGYANLITADGPSAVADGSIQATDLASGVGGKVLQVVNGTYSTQNESNSASYVATGLTASITPSSSSNKILILYSLPLRNSTADALVTSSIFRNGSNILVTYGSGLITAASGATASISTVNYLDSPNTTSSTTYAIFVYPAGITAQWCGASALASITLLEILV